MLKVTVKLSLPTWEVEAEHGHPAATTVRQGTEVIERQIEFYCAKASAEDIFRAACNVAAVEEKE